MVLEALLRTTDFVVVAAPLTPETPHLIGEPQLALMKATAYLTDVARGPLVNESALLSALKERQIAGDGLDVWTEEPPPTARPTSP